MNVFFDYQIFYLQRYGGISRYFYELAKELDELENCKPKIVVPYNANEYIGKEKHNRFILTFPPLLKKIFYNRFYDRHIFMNEYLLRKMTSDRKNTILHETYYTNRVKTNAPRVITIHDMIYELFHNDLADEKMIIAQKKQAIEEADCIIAVSENTKKDLLNLYPAAEAKTHVVYHGVSQSAYPQINKFSRPKPFMLHVGNRGWYKNFELLLEVFGEQKNINTAFDLICFGGGKITPQEERLVNKYNLRDKVHFITGDDTVLISLYKGAAALIYISNYEGFGMPVLEAMALSCPVLSSNTSSLPEVYGNAALAIDPKSKEALIEGMTSILLNDAERKKLIRAGLERSAQFTWKKCAQETFELYKKLV